MLQNDGNSKVENYRRIKQEEAAARAQLLMQPSSQALERGALLDQSNQAVVGIGSGLHNNNLNNMGKNNVAGTGVRNSELGQISANRRNASNLGPAG